MNLKCVTTPVAWFGMPINSFFAQIHKFDHLVNNMVHFLTVLNCSFNFKRIFNNLQPSLNEYLTLVIIIFIRPVYKLNQILDLIIILIKIDVNIYLQF